MIYDRNRVSSFGDFNIAANESYTSADCMRIMYECECNDMKLFNAAVCADLAELNAMREGTLLESEAEKMAEETKASFKERIIEMLKNAWAKIKGAIQSTIHKLATLSTRGGKQFIATHKDALAALDNSTKVGKILRRNDKNIRVPEINLMAATSLKNPDKSPEMIKNFWLKQSMLSYKGEIDGNYVEAAKDFCFDALENATIGDLGGVAKLRADLLSATGSIKELKRQEKDINKAFTAMIKQLKKDAKGEEGADITHIKANANGAQAALTTVVKGGITVAKEQFYQARKALTLAMKNAKLAEATYMESVLIEAEEEKASFNDIETDDLSEEEKEAVQEIIDGVEDLIDAGDDSDEPAAEKAEEPAGDEE